MRENRYYVVKLKHDDDFFPVICKRKYVLEDYLEEFLNSDIGWSLFRENYVVGETFQDLLTGKNIYNERNGEEYGLSGKKRVGCLTYRDHYRKGENCVKCVEEISREKALEMLRALTDEQIAEYKIILNEIENDAIRAYKEMLEQEKEGRKIDKEISSFVNRGR